MEIKYRGRQYPSLDCMPTDVRQQYENLLAALGWDTNKNGIPDFLEDEYLDALLEGKTNFSFQRKQFVAHGQAFTALEDLPDDLRGTLRNILESGKRVH